MKISRDEALKSLDDIFNYCEEIDNNIPESERSGYKMLPDIQKIREYIIENTRPHGEWKRISMDKYIRHASCFYRCSVCGEDTIGETNFCPNCGASMISSNSEIEKSKSEIENSNLPERFTATDCSCLNCKNRHSVHCEPQNKKIYGYCGNWERR